MPRPSAEALAAAEAALFDHLPKKRLLAFYEAADGKELEAKFSSPGSSSALAANTFGLFVERPETLPDFLAGHAVSWPPLSIGLEAKMRFPWTGGRHPWLDVCLLTESHLIGIESKRFEPFDTHRPAKFQEAYRRPVWGERMKAFESVRDGLDAGTITYRHLNAAQLVKHAFGLRTQAKQRRALLLYLHAEPISGRTGASLKSGVIERHREEIADFSIRVAGDEVAFKAMTYRDLLAIFEKSPDPAVVRHAGIVRERYNLAP